MKAGEDESQREKVDRPDLTELFEVLDPTLPEAWKDFALVVLVAQANIAIFLSPVVGVLST